MFGLSTGALFPQVAGNLDQLLLSGSPQQFTNAGVFNPSVLTPTTLNLAGSTVSGLNNMGGVGSDSFTIGGPGTGSHVGSFFGNLGRNVAQARGPRQQLWDFYVTKSFPFREKYSFQLRSEFFNVFNHPNFLLTNLNFNPANPGAFGVYDTQAGSSRVIQLALKFDF